MQHIYVTAHGVIFENASMVRTELYYPIGTSVFTHVVYDVPSCITQGKEHYIITMLHEGLVYVNYAMQQYGIQLHLPSMPML